MLWGRLCNWLGYQKGVSDMRTDTPWLIPIAKKKVGHAEITSSVFVMIVYAIWRERNKI